MSFVPYFFLQKFLAMSWSDVMRLVQFYVKSIFLRIFPIATATVGWL